MSDRFGNEVMRLAMAWVAALGLAGSASATLLDRGPDLVYDDVLNITWTRQAGDGVFRSWDGANAWAANLVFGGFDDWRLPYLSVSAGVGPIPGAVDCSAASELACRDDEMGYMFYHDLGGSLGQNKTGTQTAVGGQQLTGILDNTYWSGTLHTDDQVAFSFTFGGGFRFTNGRGVEWLAWAVRPGDVAAAVPEASTYALMLAGLGVLGFAAGRRNQKAA